MDKPKDFDRMLDRIESTNWCSKFQMDIIREYINSLEQKFKNNEDDLK